MAPTSKPSPKLGTYRSKRDFGQTPEPSGDGPSPPARQRRFVVQHHRARREHYDFRLEVDGVLASWAVPKWPSLDPSVRALAIHVEDHPIEYGDFEGVIPGGQYGAGDVTVWDRGTYEHHGTDDPAAAIAAGELHIDLTGEKLRGRFVLVRTRPDRDGRERWLLLHKQDEFAQPGWRPEDHPRSVKSGRTNEEVAAAPDAEWRSDRPAAEAEVAVGGGVGSWRPATEGELAALDELGQRGSWQLGDRILALTNLDKVLFPARDGGRAFTKRDLIRYHVVMGPVMLPYLADRPVNLHRFPNGVDRPGFWHKQVPNHAPDWLTRWHNERARPGESDVYAVIDEVASLAWMANFGAVELHPWTSRLPDVRRPTWALIDIDPGTATSFDDVVVLAKAFRAGLDHLGLLGLPKVTGQRGLHIFVPVEPRYDFDTTRAWVEHLSRAVGEAAPELVSWTWEKRARQGRARLDFTQNAVNKTLVAPYGVRAAPGAPVSVPIEWDELDTPGLRSDLWTIDTVVSRVAERGDPFRRLVGQAQRLPEL